MTHRAPSQLKHGTQRLIAAIWAMHGGASTVARMLNLASVQNTLNWKYFGKVPLTHVGKVSRLLNIPPHALNYTEVCDFFGSSVPWEEVVQQTGIPRHTQAYVLSGEPPPPYEGGL